MNSNHRGAPKVRERSGRAFTLWRALKASLGIKTPFSIFVALLGFPLAFLPVWIASALSELTNEVQAMFDAGAANGERVITSLVSLMALLVLQLLFQYANSVTASADSLRIYRYIKEKIIDISCRASYKYIENYDDFKSRVQFVKTYAGESVAASMQKVLLIIQMLITFISIVISLSRVSAWIVLILLASSVPSVLLARKQSDETYRRRAKWTDESRYSMHLSYTIASDVAIDEIRSMGLFPYLRDKWRAASDRFIQDKSALTQKHVATNAIADVLRNSVYVAVLLIIANMIFEYAALGLGIFTLTISLASQLQNVTARLLTAGVQFSTDIKYMEDFFALDELELEPEGGAPLECHDIEFNNVSFTYPGGERPAINGVAITIRHGEKIAIVGENGSGKTTLINLLCGILQPDQGEITIGGYKYADNPYGVRRDVSIVVQDFARYEATLRENITIADIEKQSDDESICALSKLTWLSEVIAEQSHGLDETIGMASEAGNDLSGGQWQKVAITRALYKDCAEILILDEPTSALDPIAESELYSQFAKLTGQKTAILISHRLGIVKNVDRILCFKEGALIEAGTHEELMRLNGHYAKMYRAQVRWYV